MMPPTNQRPPVLYDDGVVHYPHDDGHGHDDMHNDDVAHEHTDVNLRAIGTSVVILAVVAIVAQIAMYFLFGWFERDAAANEAQISPLATPATQMPAERTRSSPAFSQGAAGPELLTNEPMALEKYRSQQQKRLQGYGWVDQNAGVAHMPIDQAKKLVAERGLPAREGSEPPSFRTRPWVRGESSGGRVITTPLPEPGAAPAQPPAQEHGQGAQPAPKPHPGGHQ